MVAGPDTYLLEKLQRHDVQNARYITEKKLNEAGVIIGFDDQLFIPSHSFELTPAIETSI